MNKQDITNLINSMIIDNENGLITAETMRDVLNAINEGAGDGYTFVSTATPSTTPIAITEDSKVFYIATEEGEYHADFGIIKPITELTILRSDSGRWRGESLGAPIGTTEKINELQTRQTSLEENVTSKLSKQDVSIATFQKSIRTQVDEYKPIEINGNVSNAADEEDLTSKDGLLQIKDRGTLYGKGYKILRRGIDLQSQFNQENTIYEIRYDFDLGGGTLNIPARCTLKFEGGSFKNGTLLVDNSSVKSYDVLRIIAQPYQIFYNIYIDGLFNSDKMYIEWFGAKASTDCTEAFRYALKFCSVNESSKYEKNIALYLSRYCVYNISDSINYYDGEYHDVNNITFIGIPDSSNASYPDTMKRSSCLFLTREVKMFKDCSIDNVILKDISIIGDYNNNVTYNNIIFYNVYCHRLIIDGCRIFYVNTLFYNSGVWYRSRISNNRIMGCYNFSLIDDNASSKNKLFVDSEIFGNYINGNAPSSLTEIDNYFFTWETCNGSMIYNNFIDYYRVMYNNVYGTNGYINSTNNHYQVFQYFHMNSNVMSVKDMFNWNNPEQSSISEVMGKYKKMYISIGEDSVEVPSYIATDRYKYNVVFKDVILEANIGNVLWITGLNTGLEVNDFIVTVNETKSVSDLPSRIFRGSDDIPETGTIIPNECYCYLYHKLKSTRIIDKKFAETFEDFPKKEGAWCRISVNEYVYISDYIYKMIYDNQLRDVRFISADNQYQYSTSNVYIEGGSLSIKSRLLYCYGAPSDDGKYVNNIIPKCQYVRNNVITIISKNLFVINFLKDKFNNPLALDKGDYVQIFIDNYDNVYMLGYYKVSERNVLGSKRPSSPPMSFQFFDTTLNKPIWWNGTNWVDSSGEVV